MRILLQRVLEKPQRGAAGSGRSEFHFKACLVIRWFPALPSGDVNVTSLLSVYIKRRFPYKWADAPQFKILLTPQRRKVQMVAFVAVPAVFRGSLPVPICDTPDLQKGQEDGAPSLCGPRGQRSLRGWPRVPSLVLLHRHLFPRLPPVASFKRAPYHNWPKRSLLWPGL